MKTSNVALRTTPLIPLGNELDSPFPPDPETFNRGFQAENGHKLPSLRAYTEQQVSVMLQVSLSQLRKWRMGRYRGKQEGPPFKKFGRLVRYPEEGLLTYING
jgi:hypothetical protein